MNTKYAALIVVAVAWISTAVLAGIAIWKTGSLLSLVAMFIPSMLSVSIKSDH